MNERDQLPDLADAPLYDLFPDDLGRIADAFDTAAENAADWLRTGPSLRAVLSDGNML